MSRREREQKRRKKSHEQCNNWNSISQWKTNKKIGIYDERLLHSFEVFCSVFVVSFSVCMTVLNNYERLLASMQFLFGDWSFTCLWREMKTALGIEWMLLALEYVLDDNKLLHNSRSLGRKVFESLRWIWVREDWFYGGNCAKESWVAKLFVALNCCQMGNFCANIQIQSFLNL